MSVARRNFFVPPDSNRCEATVKTAAGNPDGRCMRRKLSWFNYCAQHVDKHGKHPAPDGDKSP